MFVPALSNLKLYLYVTFLLHRQMYVPKTFNEFVDVDKPANSILEKSEKTNCNMV